MRLASWMPFEPARELLQDLLGIEVSKVTAWRTTLATGQAQLAVCEKAMERLKRELPQVPRGAEKQGLSGDGAMVHLVGGEGGEGKHARTGRGDAQ